MTSAEIIQGAARIFRMCVTATWNDSFGQDDGTMNITMARLVKAVAWARENNEVEAMKRVLNNVAASYSTNIDMNIMADNIIDTIFS